MHKEYKGYLEARTPNAKEQFNKMENSVEERKTEHYKRQGNFLVSKA